MSKIIIPASKIVKTPISFSMTKSELLSGNKTVTRRNWSDRYVKRFISAYKEEKYIEAISAQLRYGGTTLGYIKLTQPIYKECILDITSEEIIKEGFPNLSKEQFLNKYFGDLLEDIKIGKSDGEIYVVHFEFYSVNQVEVNYGF
jgi:hypothetical protein